MSASDQGQRPASEPSAQSVPVDSSRRRFARAGLSGTVVLGSLVSKPVLGASAAPYHCTVSGQISGNLSRPGSVNACLIGDSPSTWFSAASWPEPFDKGTAPSKDCKFNGNLVEGTKFNGFTQGTGVPALSAAFFSVATGTGNAQACSLTLTATGNPAATMLQVLASDNTGEQFDLGRVVVTSLLNAASMGAAYPVTTHTIIAMFNATFGGGTYPVTSTNSWSRTRVVQYLQSLNKA